MSVIANAGDMMRSSATEFIHAKSACEKVKLDVDVELGELRSGWTGESSAAYQQMFTAWMDEFTALTQGFANMSQLLDNGARAFDLAEAQNQ
jgi:WXG100 family type VII secretion target